MSLPRPDGLLGRALYWFDDHPVLWVVAVAAISAGIALVLAWFA